MFIDDYRPTKRIGMEELHGAINAFVDKLDEMADNGEAHSDMYVGALITLELIEKGRYEYPRDFLAVFENQANEFIEVRS